MNTSYFHWISYESMKAVQPCRESMIYGNTYACSWRTCWSWQSSAPLGTRRTLQREEIQLCWLDWYRTLCDRYQDIPFVKYVKCHYNSLTWTLTPGSPWLPCERDNCVMAMDTRYERKECQPTQSWKCSQLTFTPAGPWDPLGPMGPWLKHT